MQGQESLMKRLKCLLGFSGKKSKLKPQVHRCPKSAGGFSPSVLEVLVIDASGSMADEDYKPTRLDGAKKASSAFLKKLRDARPEGLVAIVSFDTNAKVVCQPLPVKNELSRIETRVGSPKADGFTNMASALNLAGRIITKCSGARTARVLLLTDGHANEGGDPEPVAKKLKQFGVQLDIIGIGGSPSEVNEEQLRRMASVVDGERRYWFIKNVPMLVKKFEALALREVK